MREQEITINTPQPEHLSGGLLVPHLVHPFNTRQLREIHAFLMEESISNGGNIRDKTLEDIQRFTRNGGQIWTMVHGSEIIAVQTLEPMEGMRMPWWYINNGHTKVEWRGQGVASELVAQGIALNSPEVGYFVIYVRQNLFDRLGFQEISIDHLISIDERIAQIVRGKLRPGKEAHIFIRTPKGSKGVI